MLVTLTWQKSTDWFLSSVPSALPGNSCVPFYTLPAFGGSEKTLTDQSGKVSNLARDLSWTHNATPVLPLVEQWQNRWRSYKWGPVTVDLTLTTWCCLLDAPLDFDRNSMKSADVQQYIWKVCSLPMEVKPRRWCVSGKSAKCQLNEDQPKFKSAIPSKRFVEEPEVKFVTGGPAAPSALRHDEEFYLLIVFFRTPAESQWRHLKILWILAGFNATCSRH